MSELLNSLNVPESPAKSWASEVAEAAASEPAAVAAEAHAPEPAPDKPEAPEAAPEAPQAQEAAPEQDGRRVPLKALQEERAKRAEYERRLQDYERQLSEMRQRMEQPAAPQPEAAPEPDPETDPIGALKHAREQLRRMQEETARQQHEAQLNAIAYQSAVQFSQQAPDYQEAYRYAVESRRMELEAIGVDSGTIPDILRREEMNLVETAVRNRRNPAEAIYHFAKARGFQGRTAQPAPAPAPKPAAPDPALQQAKAAVAASAASGGAPAAKGEVSVADLANLKGAAFDAAWNKLFGANKSSIFRE